MNEGVIPVRCEDIDLAVRYFPSFGEPAATEVLFPGIDSDPLGVYGQSEYDPLVQGLRQNSNVAIASYRGHPPNRGRFTRTQTLEDMAIVCHEVRRSEPDLPLITVGHSEGAHYAVEMANRGLADAFVMFMPFAGIQYLSEEARSKLLRLEKLKQWGMAPVARLYRNVRRRMNRQPRTGLYAHDPVSTYVELLRTNMDTLTSERPGLILISEADEFFNAPPNALDANFPRAENVSHLMPRVTHNGRDPTTGEIMPDPAWQQVHMVVADLAGRLG